MSFLDDKDRLLSQGAHNCPAADDSELSELNDTWRNLLGVNGSAFAANAENMPESIARSPVPVADDPWGELLHSQGIELVDLQHYRPQTVQVSFSEQEVEQALQFLQEQ